RPFSVSMLPRSPASTLFPYTTLFRSRGEAVALRHLVGVRLALRDDRRDGASGLRGALRPSPGPRDHHAPHGRDAAILRGPRGRRDRKSTRLNSSHVAISYAVFCLKKK